MANLLEGPVYTKPPLWRGRDIPEVLLSGHHGKIARWRRDQALRRTTQNRPDLIERCEPKAFDKKDREMLSVLGWEPDPDGEPYGRFLAQGRRRGRIGRCCPPSGVRPCHRGRRRPLRRRQHFPEPSSSR
ncbi:hypothetical protein GCM10020256_20040 [Streptomyces thermocoprophilus]